MDYFLIGNAKKTYQAPIRLMARLATNPNV